MPLKHSTKQILEELFESNPNNDFYNLENDLDHNLQALVNILDKISEMDILEDEKQMIFKRIILSIKNKDVNKTLKLVRGLRTKYES